MEQKFSYRDSKGVTHRRLITGEEYQHGRRIYLMEDPDTKEQYTGIADEIDQQFLPRKGQILVRPKKGFQGVNKRRAGGR
ncbi:hypothetical protein [Chitinophaga lutea]|uniref:hypothetical protein n=1 Tax=Chitinophaga lutea TaxID=2488634 RepID=UPI000F508AEA|nr:hypothetical protein [Chitinophaga lutea]